MTEADLQAQELENYAEVSGEDPKGEKLFASAKVTLKKEQTETVEPEEPESPNEPEIPSEEDVSALPSTCSAKEYWPLLGLLLFLGGGGYLGSLLLKSERRKKERPGARL